MHLVSDVLPLTEAGLFSKVPLGYNSTMNMELKSVITVSHFLS